MCYIVTPWRGFGSGLGSALLLFWQIPRPPDCPSQTSSAAPQPPAAKSRLRSGALIHGHVARIGGPTEPTPAHRDAPERTGPVQAWWSHHLRPTDGDYHDPGENPATCGSGRATLRRAHDRCDLRRRGSCYRPRRAGQSPAYRVGTTADRKAPRPAARASLGRWLDLLGALGRSNVLPTADHPLPFGSAPCAPSQSVCPAGSTAP